MCAVFLLLGMGASSALAQNESLQDLWFNVNGSNTELAAPGVNLGGYNTGTGLGTITFTDLNTGSQYFNTWWQEAVSVPFFNEYGTAVGTASSGETWEIGDAYTSTSFLDAEGGALLHENLLPEGADNFLGTCTGACNGTGSTALGYAFDLSSGFEEIVTLKVSQTAPTS